VRPSWKWGPAAGAAQTLSFIRIALAGQAGPSCGSLLGGGDDLPDHLVPTRIEALLPPHYQVGGQGPEQRYPERRSVTAVRPRILPPSDQPRRSMRSLPLTGNVRANPIWRKRVRDRARASCVPNVLQIWSWLRWWALVGQRAALSTGQLVGVQADMRSASLCSRPNPHQMGRQPR
jgi:hypothetical protein